MFNMAVDINNLLYRIYDGYGNVLGEVHCCFTKEEKLVRFKLYRAFGCPNIEIDKYFNKYIKDLANRFGIELTNSATEDDFELLNCEGFYFDGTYSFD